MIHSSSDQNHRQEEGTFACQWIPEARIFQYVRRIRLREDSCSIPKKDAKSSEPKTSPNVLLSLVQNLCTILDMASTRKFEEK